MSRGDLSCATVNNEHYLCACAGHSTVVAAGVIVVTCVTTDTSPCTTVIRAIQASGIVLRKYDLITISCSFFITGEQRLITVKTNLLLVALKIPFPVLLSE